MGSSVEDLTLENSLNEFIKSNSNDKLFVDVETPSCKLVPLSPMSSSPSSNTSPKGARLRRDINELLNEVSQLSKNLNVYEVSRSLAPDLTQKPNSSRSSGRSSNGNFSKNLVDHAQAVIEYQRERIDILENIISKFNSAMDKVNELHKDELERSEIENKNIRLQIHKVVSDYDAIIKKKDSEIREIEALKEKNLKSDSELVKKDEQIKEMSKKLEILPLEIERVKSQRDELLYQVKELKNELNPPYKSWQRSLEDLQEDNEHTGSSQPPLTTFEYQTQFGFNYRESTSKQPFAHFLCDIRKQETSAMGRCLMQVENDLTSYKRLHEEQKSEINRLNYLLSIKAKTEGFDENTYFGSHKQLLYMRNLFVEMVKKSNELTEKINQKKEETVEREDRSVQAAFMVKSLGEQREMYDKLLEAVKNKISVESSGTYFYRCKVDYCKLSEVEQMNLDLKFNKMFAEIENSMVLVHQMEDDQIIHTQTISRENLKAVRSDPKNLQMMLKDDHYHVFRLGDLDSYKRFKYGLMYAGFLLDETKLSIFSKIDLSDQNTLENLPKDMVPVLFSKVVSLGAQNPNYISSSPNYSPNSLEQRYHQSSLDFLVSNMFDNVSILSDFTEKLAYYDLSCNVLVLYGPNLANNPKVIHPKNTYKFLVKNDLDNSTGLNQAHTGEVYEFIEEYKVPLATFPNGEHVMNYFNPQLNNYSLVSVKKKSELFVPGVHNGYYQNSEALNVLNSPNVPCSTSPTPVNRNFMNLNNPDFEVYFILPLSPKYNDTLTKLMNRIEFLRLKSTFSKLSEHKIEIKEKKKFYKFIDGVLEMKMGPSSDGPVRIPCSDGQYEFDDIKSEVTLLSNSDSGCMESFKFSIPDFSMYKEFVSELNKNGFVPLNPGAEVGRGQFCLVTKDLITIFNKKVSPDPILVFNVKDTKVEVEDKARNIKIVNYETGTCVDMKCLKKGVYPRWIFALKFAGFLDDDGQSSDVEDTTTLNEFLFEIHIFDYDSKGEKAFKFENDTIKLYASPHGQSQETKPLLRPLYVWNRESINIELRAKNSSVRIYVNKGKKSQEFFEIQFIPPAYDDFISELKKHNYKIDSPDKLKSTNHQYVVSLKEVIQLRQSMDSPNIMLKIQKQFYQCSVDIEAMKVNFSPTVNYKTPIELPFKKQDTFLKFLLALKISTFLPFTKKGTDIPINFLPEITYCFACPEARKLFKNCRQ